MSRESRRFLVAWAGFVSGLLVGMCAESIGLILLRFMAG